MILQYADTETESAVRAVWNDYRHAIMGWYDKDGSLGGPQAPYVFAVSGARLDGDDAELLLHVDTQEDADAMRWLFELPLEKGVLSVDDQSMVDAVRSVPYRFDVLNLSVPKAA